MRVRTVLLALLAGSTFAAAQPGPPGEELPPPEAPTEPVEVPVPEPAPLPPPPAPAPVVVTPAAPGAPIPPITINITNNNTGNNSNTNTQTNSQANPQTTTQTNTAPVTVTTTVAAPGTVAPLSPVRADVDHHELLCAKTKAARWITLGVTRDHHGPPSGVRGSIDLLGRGAFTLGVAAALSHDGDGMHRHARGDDDHGQASARVIGYVAWTGKLGRLDLRAQVGLGAGTELHGHDRDGDDATIKRTTDGTTTGGDSPHRRFGHLLGMRAEAAVLVGLPLGKHFGLVAGPVISAAKPDAGENKAIDAQLVAGLRYRF